jgi:hypothetical protein
MASKLGVSLLTNNGLALPLRVDIDMEMDVVVYDVLRGSGGVCPSRSNFLELR